MSVIANAFIKGARIITNWQGNTNLFLVSFGDTTIPLMPIFSLLLVACLILLVRRIFSIETFHGPADTIYAAHRHDTRIEVRTGIGSTLAAFLSASGGASVGQYGPLVHFAATIGSFVRRKLPLSLSNDIFIGCGVAAAISAGFNAPIAGILFAHEAILRHVSVRTVIPVAIASISSAGFSRLIFGTESLFQITTIPVPLLLLLPAALCSGPIFGLVASLYMHAIRTVNIYANKTKLTIAQKLIIAALGMGLIGTILPVLFGFGITEINLMFESAFSTEMLLIMIIGKSLITAFCIAFGLFGGVFAPALFVGAAAGSVAQKILLSLGWFIPMPALVTCGMAAVGSAVIGAPISGVIIMLELTMSYEYALAAMLSVVLSLLISHHLFGLSFYDRQLADRGIDITKGRLNLQVTETAIRPMIRQDYLSFKPDIPVADAIRDMTETATTEAYILGDNRQFIGKIALHMLLKASDDVSPDKLSIDKKSINKAPITDHMIDAPLIIPEDASLLHSIEQASDFVGEHIPVVDTENGQLVGILSESDIFQAYLRLQTQIASR